MDASAAAGGPQQLVFESNSMVMAVGPAGIGKTTFFRTRLGDDAVLSSDEFRRQICGDAGNQDPDVTREAFRRLYATARERAAQGLPSVIDSIGLKARDRRVALELAAEMGVPIHAVVLTGAAHEARAGQLERGERIMPPGVDERMQKQLAQTLRDIPSEPYDSLTVLDRAQASAVKRIGFGS